MLLNLHLVPFQLHDNQIYIIINYLVLLIPLYIYYFTVDINLPSLISLAIGGLTLITTLKFSFEPSFYFINKCY